MAAPARVLATLLFLILLAPSSAAADAGVQPDGTILVSELVREAGEQGTVVAAFTPDGEPDPGYGASGAIRIYGGGPALAVLPDGRARVLVNRTGTCNPGPVEDRCYDALFLERLSAAGERQDPVKLREVGLSDLEYTSFDLAAAGEGLLELSADELHLVRRNADGGVIAAAELDEERYVLDVEPMGDGAVVFGGRDVGRLGPELEPVTGFGGDGWNEMPFHVWAVEADGERLLVAGDEQLARLLPDGSLDPDFGDGGVAALPAAVAGYRPVRLVAAPDGSVTVGASNDGDFAVARLRPSGDPDPDFGGGDGTAVVDFGGTDWLTGLVAAEEGAMVLAGATEAEEGEERRIALARLDGAGALDADFGDGGKTVATADVAAPEIVLDDVPPQATPIDGTSVRVAVSSPDPDATLTCNGRPCAEPVTFKNLSYGTFIVEIKAVDPAGNERTVRHWLYIAPQTRPLGGPPALTREPAASFTWESVNRGEYNAAAPPSFRCRLDGGEWRTCESGDRIEGLADGEHTFEVLQSVRRYPSPDFIDELESERWTWTVDTRPPATSLTGVSTPGSSALLTFTTGEAGTTSECSLDDAPFTPCGSPASYSGLAPGMHTVRIRSIDTAGNREERGTSATWRVDAPAPCCAPPPVITGPTLAQQRQFAREALELRVSRSGRLRRAKAVALSVGSGVRARVRVTGSLRMKGRRRAIRLRAFSGRVEADRTVRAKLRLSRAARAVLRRRGGPRAVSVTLKVVLSRPDGVRLVTRTVRVRLRR